MRKPHHGDTLQPPLHGTKTVFDCKFILNAKPQSKFEIQTKSSTLEYAAFSGHGPHVNRRESACVKDGGPLPPGRYYIVDRQSGGRLEWLRNLFSDHSLWFALYAIDDRIDDETRCGQIMRGNFRLHPRGPRGISDGCITIQALADFQDIRLRLRSEPAQPVPDTKLSAYGIVEVA